MVPIGFSPREGDRVSFRIADVFLPEPEEALAALTVDVEAEGLVVEFSDSGAEPRTYAVVQITARQTVLIPVSALHVVDGRIDDETAGEPTQQC